jgi:hypothetical protein
MTTRPELFAIVRLADNEVIWSGVRSPDDAQYTAVVAAVNGHGSVSLLSGADLGRFLTKGEAA